MKVGSFVGKTLDMLSRQTGVFWNIVHVFLVEGETDDTGKHLMDAFSLKQVVAAYPLARDAKVVAAYKLCGETVLRIKI